MEKIELNPVLATIKKALLELKHNSIWGKGIDELKRDPTDYHFLQLLADLKRAVNDEPSVMIDILGNELMTLVIQVRLPQRAGICMDIGDLQRGATFIIKDGDCDVFEILSQYEYHCRYRLAGQPEARIVKHYKFTPFPVYIIKTNNDAIS